MKNFNTLFIYLIKVYQWLISPIIGQNCRYYPTCSAYCIESLQKHSVFYALFYLLNVLLNVILGEDQDMILFHKIYSHENS